MQIPKSVRNNNATLETDKYNKKKISQRRIRKIKDKYKATEKQNNVVLAVSSSWRRRKLSGQRGREFRDVNGGFINGKLAEKREGGRRRGES